jgi:hypothetical protein
MHLFLVRREGKETRKLPSVFGCAASVFTRQGDWTLNWAAMQTETLLFGRDWVPLAFGHKSIISFLLFLFFVQDQKEKKGPKELDACKDYMILSHWKNQSKSKGPFNRSRLTQHTKFTKDAQPRLWCEALAANDKSTGRAVRGRLHRLSVTDAKAV